MDTAPASDTTTAVVLGGPELVLAIDADCPACGWPERTFSLATGLFGCTGCAHTSPERDA